MADGHPCEKRGCGENEEDQDSAKTTATGRGRSGSGRAGCGPRRQFGLARDRRWLGRLFAGKRLGFLVAEREIKGDVADFRRRAAAQRDHLVADAVELDAIGRADVVEFVAALDSAHFRVMHRDRAGFDRDVVVAAAAQGDRLAVELEAVGLGVFLRNGDRDAGHGCVNEEGLAFLARNFADLNEIFPGDRSRRAREVAGIDILTGFGGCHMLWVHQTEPIL